MSYSGIQAAWTVETKGTPRAEVRTPTETRENT